MKTSMVIQDTREYRSNEIDSDHYLLCAKVNFPPRWLNRSNKKAPLKKEEFFKVRLLTDESIRWLYTQRVKLHLNNTKENEFDIEEEWKKLQNIKISRTIKRRNRGKYLKIWDDQIKQLIETKKKSCNKWLTSNKLKTNWNTKETLH
jgi:hypothetical protein